MSRERGPDQPVLKLDPTFPNRSHLFAILQSQNRALILLLQQRRLPPKRIRLKAPKSPLDPIPAVTITSNLLPRPESARQEARLTSEENPTAAEQTVSRDIAERAGFHRFREVWQRLLLARREAQSGRLLGRLELLENCAAGAADTEGQEGPQREAEKRADAGVGRYGAGGFVEGVAVGLLEAVGRGG